MCSRFNGRPICFSLHVEAESVYRAHCSRIVMSTCMHFACTYKLLCIMYVACSVPAMCSNNQPHMLVSVCRPTSSLKLVVLMVSHASESTYRLNHASRLAEVNHRYSAPLSRMQFLRAVEVFFGDSGLSEALVTVTRYSWTGQWTHFLQTKIHCIF